MLLQEAICMCYKLRTYWHLRRTLFTINVKITKILVLKKFSFQFILILDHNITLIPVHNIKHLKR